jgi:hypothetical protein
MRFSRLLVRAFILVVAGSSFVSAGSAATSLPVGPITFGANSDYDANFKESPQFSGISRNINGYLEASGAPTATAAFDMSATGGMNGQGGTGGSDANNDLSDCTMSADVASSVAGGIGAGFLFRLNSAEGGGYLATVHTLGTTSVAFDISEGASLTSAGNHIFSVTVPLNGLVTAANAFYNFKVSLSGGFFFFEFGSGAATATFTDPTVTATTGQAGILLDVFSPSAATRLDNFEILPAIATIDFESLAQTGVEFRHVGYIYIEKGFVFTDSRGVNGLGSFQSGSPYYAGSTMLFNNSESDTSMSRQDGGRFDFIGIDLAKLQYSESGPITFSGYRGSDLVVSEIFNFDGNAGVQRFIPHADFSRLTEVRWPQQHPLHQFDNVMVRPRGGAGPGPQVRIVNGESVWRLDFSGLVPGKTYTVQKSVDLAAWEDRYSFTTYSPTSNFADPIDPNAGNVSGFYRLRTEE